MAFEVGERVGVINCFDEVYVGTITNISRLTLNGNGRRCYEIKLDRSDSYYHALAGNDKILPVVKSSGHYL